MLYFFHVSLNLFAVLCCRSNFPSPEEHKIAYAPCVVQVIKSYVDFVCLFDIICLLIYGNLCLLIYIRHDAPRVLSQID
jgi:hypothetical protein